MEKDTGGLDTLAQTHACEHTAETTACVLSLNTEGEKGKKAVFK